MGDYNETINEVRAIKRGCYCAMLFDILVSVAVILFIKKPFNDLIYIIEKWWFVAFFASCLLSNIVQIYKANVAICNPEILIDIKW